jgi:hypothetical protein
MMESLQDSPTSSRAPKFFYLGALSWLPAPLLRSLVLPLVLEFVTVLEPLLGCISEPVCVPERSSTPPWSSLLQPTNAAATLMRMKHFFINPPCLPGSC